MILDSGNRTEFPTGGVRDMQEGKGRCDLLPLDVVNMVFSSKPSQHNVLTRIDKFQTSGDLMHLLLALDCFREDCGWNNQTMFLEVSKHFDPPVS